MKIPVYFEAETWAFIVLKLRANVTAAMNEKDAIRQIGASLLEHIADEIVKRVERAKK